LRAGVFPGRAVGGDFAAASASAGAAGGGAAEASSTTTPAHGAHAHAHFAPITWPERAGALLLIATTVYVGLKPDILLDWIEPALRSPLMQAALNGGAP
jgi:NADH-quinone oxidoreductase subunit M